MVAFREFFSIIAAGISLITLESELELYFYIGHATRNFHRSSESTN